MQSGSIFKLILILCSISQLFYSQSLNTTGSNKSLYKTNSGTWYALANGTNANVLAVAVEDSDTSVYIGGSFTSTLDSNGNSVSNTSYIAKWNGTEWVPVGRGTNNTVHIITIAGGYVYIGGDFTNVTNTDGTVVNNTSYIARWNGSEWEAIGNGTNNSVYAITVESSNVYVGGAFTNTINGDGSSVSGTRKIAEWDGSSWSPIGYGGDDHVYEIILDGNNLYAGGQFGNMKNNQFETVFYTQSIARWDGTEWHAVGQGVQGTVNAMEIIGSNLYAVGSFPNAYESDGTLTSVNYIGVWDGSSWSTLGNGADWVINDIISSNNQIYVCGTFNNVKDEFNINVSNTQYIAKWTGSQWNTLTFADKPNDVIKSLALGDGRMYVGGSYTSVGGAANTNYISYFTDASNTLPVELISFTASKEDENIRLEWQTATEINNYGFEIDRASSTNSVAGRWENIGFVAGHGNSSSPKSYTFTDENPYGEMLEYRLKQIDTDGSFKYYESTVRIYNNISSLNNGSILNGFVLHQNYPNPFNPATTIEYQIPVQAMPDDSHARNDNVNVTLIVFDILGREVTTLVDRQQKPGTHKVLFDASLLSSGVYFYNIRYGDRSISKKMLLMQ